MNAAPTLLVLAAGSGSRYGGLKQIDPVGPSGETLLDYAVFDARRAGFGKVVFVIRRDFEEAFRARAGARYKGMKVDYAFQEMAELPAGFGAIARRDKPWGTTHAVWCARGVVRENFAVINADDFYGADSYRRLASFLGQAGLPGSATPATVTPAAASLEFALVGFRLDRTLSEHGAVSRGVCRVEADRLKEIVEHAGIRPLDVGQGKTFAGTETVSMNCWAFTPQVFGSLESHLGAFLRRQGSDPKAECYLPVSVSEMIAGGEASVSVLPTRDAWLGITFRDDKARVSEAIAAMVRTGVYPSPLF